MWTDFVSNLRPSKRRRNGRLAFVALSSLSACGEDNGVSGTEYEGQSVDHTTGVDFVTDPELIPTLDEDLEPEDADTFEGDQNLEADVPEYIDDAIDVANADINSDDLDNIITDPEKSENVLDTISDDGSDEEVVSSEKTSLFSLVFIDDISAPADIGATYNVPTVLEVPTIDQSYSEDFRSTTKTLAKFLPLSGDQTIDALIVGNKLFTDQTDYIWTAKTEPIVISFSFVDPILALLDTEDYGDAGAELLVRQVNDAKILEFAEEQKSEIRKAFSYYEQIINIKFVEIIEAAGEVGTIRVGLSDANFGDTVAFALQPGNYWASSGDIWFDKKASSGNFAEGEGYYFFAILHELGHALGLKHPHEAFFTNETVLDPRLDYTNYTIMSYNDPDWVEVNIGADVWSISNGPQVLDIQALQFLYGPNTTFNSEDTRYIFEPNNPYAGTIWDAGGQDLLDFSHLSVGAEVDMNPGAYSTVPVPGWSPLHNLGIAYGVIIENIIGTNSNDIITGNGANNILLGNLGDDVLYGGAGDDIFELDPEFSHGTDRLFGGMGDDIYYLGVGDLVFEEPDEGHDTVILVDVVEYTLPQDVERVLSVSDVDSKIFGNAGDNIIQGGGGDDLLVGGLGADIFTVYEGMGNDVVMDFSSVDGDQIAFLDPSLEYETSLLDSGFLITISDSSTLHVVTNHSFVA